MAYLLFAFLGAGCGAICVFFLLETRRRQLDETKHSHDGQKVRLEQANKALEERRQELEQWAAHERARLEQYSQQETAARANEQAAQAVRQEQDIRAVEARRQELAQWVSQEKSRLEQQFLQVRDTRAELDARAISFVDLSTENAILKTDLRNLFLEVRKLRLDHEQGSHHRATLDERVQDLGSRYLKDHVKWIGNSLNANNFANCKQKLQAVIDRCRNAGLPVSPAEEASLLVDLKAEYERVVRAAFEREEQSRIKSQIRDEQLREKEIERELKKLDREREAIKAALDKALAEANDQHSAEVEQLMARLAEAEARSQRVVSQAQLTKSGYVYVISNIGSFGDGVYKVGMTRRLEPMDRVRELGDASVPFPFDVHMMISCDDAPSLENALHRLLHKQRVNKTNPRKEFFRCDLDAILETVKAHHGEVEYRVDPEALQYRQSLTMTEEDLEFIESVYDELDDEDAV